MKKKTIEKLKFEKLTIIELKSLISIRGGVEDKGGVVTHPTDGMQGNHAPVLIPGN